MMLVLRMQEINTDEAVELDLIFWEGGGYDIVG